MCIDEKKKREKKRNKDKGIKAVNIKEYVRVCTTSRQVIGLSLSALVRGVTSVLRQERSPSLSRMISCEHFLINAHHSVWCQTKKMLLIGFIGTTLLSRPICYYPLTTRCWRVKRPYPLLLPCYHHVSNNDIFKVCWWWSPHKLPLVKSSDPSNSFIHPTTTYSPSSSIHRHPIDTTIICIPNFTPRSYLHCNALYLLCVCARATKDSFPGYHVGILYRCTRSWIVNGWPVIHTHKTLVVDQSHHRPFNRAPLAIIDCLYQNRNYMSLLPLHNEEMSLMAACITSSLCNSHLVSWYISAVEKNHISARFIMPIVIHFLKLLFFT